MFRRIRRLIGFVPLLALPFAFKLPSAFQPGPSFQTLSHTRLSKKEYVTTILDSPPQGQYFLIVCDRGLPKQQLDKHIATLTQVAERLNITGEIYSVEALDLDELEKVANRLKNKNKVEEKKQQRSPPAADIYFKGMAFDRMVLVQGQDADSVEKKVGTIKNLIRDFAERNDIERALNKAKRNFDAPVIVKHVSNQAKCDEFKAEVYQLLNSGVITPSTKILITRQPIKIDNTTISNDKLFILKNDILSQQQTNVGLIPIPTNSSLQKEIVPRIHLIRNSNYHQELARLFKVINRNKLAFTLTISNKKPNQMKLRLIADLYKKFSDKVVFIVVATDQIEELFVHTAEGTGQELVAFNFFKTLGEEVKGGYLRPYQKVFLGNYRNDISYEENLLLLDKELQNLLSNKKEMNDFNILLTDRQQQINLKKLKNLLEGDKHFLLRFCNKKCTPRKELLETDVDLYWINTSIHNVQDFGDVIVDPVNKVVQSI